MSKKKKLTTEQKKNIQIILSWYNLAWAMSNDHHDKEQKRIADKASGMIEDIIINQ